MGTLLESQFQVINSATKGSADLSLRRPIIRPSILFDPKDAADLDVRDILPLSLSGLDALAEMEPRFAKYRGTLFSQISLDIDRETMEPKEEKKLSSSITSFLRLLAGYLHHHPALKALEYLIRRHLVHVYNMEDLILCALPYHDSNVFVRIIQLIDFGNTIWAFLEGSKASGARPPRKVIVQQCIRDKGILEAISNYASPTEEFQHTTPVVCFSTAIIIEALGSVQEIDTDTVHRVKNFVFSGLKPGMKGTRDHKAGALMVVGLLATRASLANKLVQNFISVIAKMAQQDAVESVDMTWLRVAIMAIVTLVQSQPSQMLPKKTMAVLNQIRDFTGILAGLSEEFNTQKFLSIYIEALVEYSTTDESFRHTLHTLVETFPSKIVVEKTVSKVLSYLMKLSRSGENPDLSGAGKWTKQIFHAIHEHNPAELRAAARKYFESSTMNSREQETSLCRIFAGNVDYPVEISDSMIFLSLEHPQSWVRQAALSALDTSTFPKDMATNPQELINLRNAILSRLRDDELGVVKAALSRKGLSNIVDLPSLLDAYGYILRKCNDLMMESNNNASQASDVAIMCLQNMVADFGSEHSGYSKDVAKMLFSFLLIHPKTWKINLKALELVEQVQWHFLCNSSTLYEPAYYNQLKRVQSSQFASINMKTAGALAESLMRNPDENLQWLMECCERDKVSKCLFFLILLQALVKYKEANASGLLRICDTCSRLLKSEWCEVESRGNIFDAEEMNFHELDISFFVPSFERLNPNVLLCIFYAILEAYQRSVNRNASADDHQPNAMIDDLFIFFAKAKMKGMFRKHLQFLVRNCCKEPFDFLSQYFTEEGFPVEVQIESLLSLANICSAFPQSSSHTIMHLISSFPSLLIPLSNENKDIRNAALKCVEELQKLWCTLDRAQLRNGGDTLLSNNMLSPTFGDMLECLVNQKKLLLSDVHFLGSYLESLLSSSSNSLMIPSEHHKSFDQPAKEALLLFIVRSAVRFSSYGKLMILSLLRGIGDALLHMQEVKQLLFGLLERHSNHYLQLNKSYKELSPAEVKILCLLLEVSVSMSGSRNLDEDVLDWVVTSLRGVNGLSSEDLAVVQPCLSVLKNMTRIFYSHLNVHKQDELFSYLVVLFRSDNGDIRDAARDALLRLDFDSSTIIRLLEMIITKGCSIGSSKRIKRDGASLHRCSFFLADKSNQSDTSLSLLCSLLDVLLLKDIKKRVSLIQPLFHLLEKLFSNDWVHSFVGQDDEGSRILSQLPESTSSSLCYAQQMTLLVLKDLAVAFSLENSLKEDILDKVNINILIETARDTKDVGTRNHIFLLISSIARVSSGRISEHIMDIFSVIGEFAVKQSDSHSQHVLEELISVLVPCLLSKTDSIEKLLQIFVDALPEIAEHRRLTPIVYLLRRLGEQNSLGLLVHCLFSSLMVHMYTTSAEVGRDINETLSSLHIHREWEYMFAGQLFDQYSCKVWFPCLVELLKEIKLEDWSEMKFFECYLSVEFIMERLQNTELVFHLESRENTDSYQAILGALVEQIVLKLQQITMRSKQLAITTDFKKKLKGCADRILRAITSWMAPSTYFTAINLLLEHPDGNVIKKTLGMLSETLKDYDSIGKNAKGTKRTKKKPSGFTHHVGATDSASFVDMCGKIINLIDSTKGIEINVKLAGVSTIEVLAKAAPSNGSILVKCLACVTKHITSPNLAMSSSCLRAASALVNVLQSKSLSELPHLMKHVLERAHEISTCPIGKSIVTLDKNIDECSSLKVTVLLSILLMLESVIENLGGFLSPYVDDILEIMVLHPEYVFAKDPKVKVKATSVRKLLTDKIPVRLMLASLLKIYDTALNCGESSLSLVFEMLTSIIGSMDRSFLASNHAIIYRRCLIALDLRRQQPEFVKNVTLVEESAIHAMTMLTLRLTETMFKPLFLDTIEWMESEVDSNGTTKTKSIDRCISFYKLVNKLTEHHRSLFVPYFKYLMESCTRNLTDDQDYDVASLRQKKKKAKVSNSHQLKDRDALSTKQWHLRALILQSLYKCFLYDTDLKFLDSSNFQVLLKPIVAQLSAESPASLESSTELPTLEVVDETIILCLGQMAVTARSDVLWKPLNHEVLMQSRNEKLRPKLLGLKVIKYLVEHLKEEYLTFLAETIPFLAELLEDVELSVKALARDILKEMETLSGESLQQYL